MKIARSARASQRIVRGYRRTGERVGFVPTMGALHEGHLRLVRQARAECDRVVVSIFVNPLQFGPREDFASYPRDPARDRRLLRAESVDLLLAPDATFYPSGFATRVRAPGLDAHLCGPFRPGHFEGVATVVTKLLHATEPDRLYLGQKDYQQAALLRRMCLDLDLPVAVRIVPTVRERDGLALSSRNVYLSPEERAAAPRLHASLKATAAEIASGRLRSSRAVTESVARRLHRASGPRFELQYAEAVSADDLQPVEPLRGRLVLAAAALLGRTRLIDNVLVRAGARTRRTR